MSNGNKFRPVKSVKGALVNYFNVPQYKEDKERMSPRNMVMFGLGTFGRDFVYNLFSAFLITYIMYTKTLTNAQYLWVTIIMVTARIFDGLNDPIMGGIVENTRSKWGRFKPWQLIGAVSTGAVIIAVFSNSLQGDNFLILLAVLYFLFSITFTMNDISYWGMMPTISIHEQDRSKIASFAQLVASAGAGLAGFAIPLFTTGKLAINSSAVSGYIFISVISVIVMIAFQLFTIFGVKEKPVSINEAKKPRMKVKEMAKVLFKNDQLMWGTLIMLLFSVGTGVVNSGLLLNYVYFEFGYEGAFTILIYLLAGPAAVLFTAFYPKLAQKFSRNKLLYATGFLMIIGYTMMLIFGLVIPHQVEKTAAWYAKFIFMIIANAFVGFGQGFYMIMMLSITYSIEYNEWKTGERKEGLILSLRPLTAKLSSAVNQGIVYVVFVAAGAFTVTNRISELEREFVGADAARLKFKDNMIKSILAGVDDKTRNTILISMCLMPIIFLVVAMLIYKKKFILTDEKYAQICDEIKQRKLESSNSETSAEKVDVEILGQDDQFEQK